MCGIAGLFDYMDSSTAESLGRELKGMTDALSHRGPDDSGAWNDADLPLFLGHRRLSIIDLSEAGHQPMLSASGRFVIVFNGEIYNFKDLAALLGKEGVRFRGHSDTEVLLAAIELWGLSKTLGQCTGMFAFALWDKKEKLLHLARDRIGKKPLYFGHHDRKFVFTSELKSLHALDGPKPEIDRNSLALFMQNNYVPSPWSIYKGIYKLPPGHSATFPINKTSAWAQEDFFENITPYWTVRDAAQNGVNNPLDVSIDEALEALQGTLSKAVSQRMIADVPLGAFLSGGIDSSLIVSLMAENSSLAAKTFSIGYKEKAYNEAQHAKKVAAHLGTDHTELYLRPDNALNVLGDLPQIYDEPFSDSSQIPTLFVSQLARQHVTVALSGDGGDELFYGYARYFEGDNLKNKASMIPAPFRKGAAACIQNIPTGAWRTIMGGRSGHRMHALADFLTLQYADQQYAFLMTHWKNAYALVNGAQERDRYFSAYDVTNTENFTHLMMLHDQLNYLPEDNLVKVDRASMAHSLEIRSPLLDHNVIELAWRIPMRLKYHDGEGKIILRRLLERYIPKELFDRPKQGFAVPVAEWLRGPLKDWGENLLNADRLREEGFLNAELVRERWDEHQNGTHDWHPRLWNVLMFQQWYEHWHK